MLKHISKMGINVFLILSFLLCMTTAYANVLKITSKQEIFYTDEGAGVPLVLIHPFPADSRIWEPQIQMLRNYFRVISLDLWGFGLSSAVNGQAFTMDAYANEVKTLLDYLQISKAIIAGESMGGYVALKFLQSYPNSVEGLILSNTQAIADNKETQAKREAIAQDVLAHGSANFIKDFIPKALSAYAPAKMHLALQRILITQEPTGIASAERGMALRYDKSSVLRKASVPILIITSDQDKIIHPEESESMYALVKNARLVVISNAGHLSSFEQPDPWNQSIVNMFFKPFSGN